jgi:hypothetical protein
VRGYTILIILLDERFDIDQLRFNAQFCSESLKWIYNVAPRQRLQYPKEKELVLMQTIKGNADKTKSMRPILEVCVVPSALSSRVGYCFFSFLGSY